MRGSERCFIDTNVLLYAAHDLVARVFAGNTLHLEGEMKIMEDLEWIHPGFQPAVLKAPQAAPLPDRFDESPRIGGTGHLERPPRIVRTPRPHHTGEQEKQE
jgi:hypothetical protein